MDTWFDCRCFRSTWLDSPILTADSSVHRLWAYRLWLPILKFEMGLTAGVTGQQRMLTSPKHLIPPPVFPGVRVSPCVYLTCISYLNFETDYSLFGILAISCDTSCDLKSKSRPLRHRWRLLWKTRDMRYTLSFSSVNIVRFPGPLCFHYRGQAPADAILKTVWCNGKSNRGFFGLSENFNLWTSDQFTNVFFHWDRFMSICLL
jgi:hypothetical protein